RLQVRRNPVALQQVVARLLAEPLDLDAAAMTKALAPADEMDAAEEAAPPPRVRCASRARASARRAARTRRSRSLRTRTACGRPAPAAARPGFPRRRARARSRAPRRVTPGLR